MKRRLFIMRSGATALAASLLPGTINKLLASEKENKRTIIIHSVYFWLKKGLSPNEEKEFLNYFELLANIPGTRSLTFGKAAKTTPREVTDNTFDYNLIIKFENLADIGKYENHPEHIKGAAHYSKYWEKVQVRDTQL